MLFRYKINFSFLFLVLSFIYTNTITPAAHFDALATISMPKGFDDGCSARGGYTDGSPGSDDDEFSGSEKSAGSAAATDLITPAKANQGTFALSEPRIRPTFFSTEERASSIQITPLRVHARSLQEIRYSMIKNIIRHGTSSHPLTQFIKTLFHCAAETNPDNVEETLWRVFLSVPTTDDFTDARLVASPLASTSSNTTEKHPSKNKISWSKELNYFFWNLDDECLRLLRTGEIGSRIVEVEDRIKYCWTAIAKKTQRQLDAAKQKKSLTKEQILIGDAIFDSPSRSSEKTFMPPVKNFLMGVLTGLHNCMILDSSSPTQRDELARCTNPFLQTTLGGACEKLALVLLNFYRYSLSRARISAISCEFAAPIGINYADGLPPHDTEEINEVFTTLQKHRLSTLSPVFLRASEPAVIEIYVALAQITGFYEAIHFPFNVLDTVVSLPRHIVKNYIDLQKPQSRACTAAGTITHSFVHPTTPTITSLRNLLARFNDYTNELLATFYHDLERFKHPTNTEMQGLTLPILRNTFCEILTLKQGNLLCFPDTDICSFELGSLIVAAKRIQTACKKFVSICEEKELACDASITSIAESKDFDATYLVRDKHIHQLVVERKIKHNPKPALMGGHVATTAFPFSIPYGLDVDSATTSGAYTAHGLQYSYSSDKTGCSIGVWHVTNQNNTPIKKFKTLFPDCYFRGEHGTQQLQEYLNTLPIDRNKTAYSTALKPKNTQALGGLKLAGTKHTLIVSHDHSFGCQVADCTRTTPLRIIMPFLVLNLPEEGTITTLLTAYPQGTDCYTSIHSAPEAMSIPYFAHTEAELPITTKDGVLVPKNEPQNLKSAYQKLQEEVIAYIIEQPIDNAIVRRIRSNTLITMDANEIRSWNYLDRGKATVGEVTMFRQADVEVLGQLHSIILPALKFLTIENTQLLITQINDYFIQESLERIDNPSAFIMALNYDLAQTREMLEMTLDERNDRTLHTLRQTLISFLRRNQNRIKRLMQIIKTSMKAHHAASAALAVSHDPAALRPASPVPCGGGGGGCGSSNDAPQTPPRQAHRR